MSEMYNAACRQIDRLEKLNGDMLQAQHRQERRYQLLLASLGQMQAIADEMSADHMTSEKHHPGYVLVPSSAFDKLMNILARQRGLR